MKVGIGIAGDELAAGNPGTIAIQHLLDIYSDLADEVVFLGPELGDLDGDHIEYVGIRWASGDSPLARVIGVMTYQFRFTKVIRRQRADLDLMYFHIGGTLLLLPLLYCRLVGLDTGLFIAGAAHENYTPTGIPIVDSVILRVIKFVEHLTLRLATKVVSLSDEQGQFDAAIGDDRRAVANVNYIDTDKFVKETPIDERSTEIAFVGRLDPVKGVDAFGEAIPELVDRTSAINATVIGDGPLKSDLERQLRINGIVHHCDLKGWVDHDELPHHLNDIVLLIVPSRSEGVPKAVLEAMSCGTIPVVAPVGGMPSLISHGETGFVLQDTDPSTISATVDTILEREDLAEVSDRARAEIVHEHSFEKVRDQHVQLLDSFRAK